MPDRTRQCDQDGCTRPAITYNACAAHIMEGRKRQAQSRADEPLCRIRDCVNPADRRCDNYCASCYLRRNAAEAKLTGLSRNDVRDLAEQTGLPLVVPTDLYRYFDNDGTLLYVGVSFSAIERASQHKTRAAWWAEWSCCTVERFVTRQQALDAERIAIIDERPRHNIVHRPN